ncbi:MAG: oligoendopeptidase F [Chloroflexi bacterium]|uniref:Oligopeptidase F n=1 Tax=Candidatus Chlorohelix allophototropha TaxID=3003348 RepID=A0A8T7M3P8_9CHLR|nr:oligoendopeptidase F [Chloroflexota bacterium]WJW65984.1 oligoendopeptidase F [Chloroflexota bacterium L227-S17]
MQSLSKRAEIDEKYRWNLESIYATEADWEKDFIAVAESLPGLEAFKGKLGESGKVLFSCLQRQDKLMLQMEQVGVYAHMRRDEDTTNTPYQALYDRAMGLWSQLGAAASFITPEIVELSDEKLADFFKQEPQLELYRFALEQIMKMKQHTRSAEVEEVLAQTWEVMSGPSNIYDMLTDADFKFGTILNEKDEEVEVTHGRYISYLESQNRRVRQDAFKTLYATYAKYSNTLASVYATSVKADIFGAKVRGYKSSLESSLKPLNVPLEVYSNLLETVNKNLPTLHRYLRVRKRMLGLDDLHMYDLYVPLVAQADRKIPYEEAVETVVKGLNRLGETYVREMATGINSRWIDVYETPGKSSGAYSSGSYTTQPFILLNYQNNLDGMYTLAHELGHSMHSFYTNKNQPFPYANYSLFVAEVASITNEALLTDHLLGQTTDSALRMYLINAELEKFRTTLFRQTMFAEFEYETHRRAEEGEALTPDLLNSIYKELNVKYYGAETVVDEEIAYEWSRIPHFYRAFYVYQYSTGISAAAALSKQIIEEGDPAVERYLQFLKSGSSKYPTDLLKMAGVDMTTPRPVQQALDHFADMVDKFEQMSLQTV